MSKNQLVFLENNQALTTSRIVAQYFDKNHKRVLEDIRAIIEQNGGVPKIGQSEMFIKSTYINKQNKQQPEYLMTRDGFSLLAMGFTGKKALQFKLKFIEEFNRMEQALKTLATADRDQRWIQTRQLGKQTRKLFTRAIKALVDYFNARGCSYPEGLVYGHLTNTIQDALGIKKGSRDFQSVKKLNQLDQAEDLAGGVILRNVANNRIQSLAEVDAQILLQLKKLNDLLQGQLFLAAPIN